MLQIRRYLKILGESRKIIDDHGFFPDTEDAGYRAVVLIYETAFRQLAGYGLPVSEEKDVLRIDTDGDTFILRKKEGTGTRIKERSIRGVARGHSLSREPGDLLAPDTICDEDVGHPSQPLVDGAGVPGEATAWEGPEEDDAAVSAAGKMEDEDIPEDYGMDETEVKEKEVDHPDESPMLDGEMIPRKEQASERPAVQVEEEKDTEDPAGEKAASNEGGDQEGSQEIDGYNTELLEGVETEYGRMEPAEMPDHMFKDDFTFSYTDIRITGANGKEAQAQVIAAPVSIDAEYPRILCCTIQGERSETVLSDNNRMRILVGGIPVKVEGRMEDGSFKSSFVLPTHYLLEGSRFEANTREFGKKGHILLEEKEENLQIHIIPATFKNNASGNAEYIYYINNNGEEIAGDTSVVKEASFMLGGKEYEIRCRWSADGILYSMAAEKGDGVGADSDVQQGQDAARP